jgi:K(+)-stimulated pyrophosphate-energized sodium pump
VAALPLHGRRRALAIVIDRLTDYFTGTTTAPVKEVNSSSGGPATTILSGLGVGYESTVWAAVVIASRSSPRS